MIVLPHSNSANERTLQSDDVSLAYEVRVYPPLPPQRQPPQRPTLLTFLFFATQFAKKFPGYTSDNLSEKGIHEVSQRRFVLVAADHPLVSAISENADKLQVCCITLEPFHTAQSS